MNVKVVVIEAIYTELEVMALFDAIEVKQVTSTNRL